jgi:endo-1,4-beta-xylanase
MVQPVVPVLARALLVLALIPPAAAVIGSPAGAGPPQTTLLWPKGAPGSEGKTGDEHVRIYEPTGDHIISNVHRPSVTVYLPSKPNGAALLIIPGGGHREIWIDHEGHNVAKWAIEHGIAGIVLKYRLAREDGSTYQVERESLADVQRAIRLIRSRAAGWHIDPERVGVIGFSAGGELAMLAGTRYAPGDPASADPIEREPCKPAFEALVYPATPRDHRITKDTPPTFLLGGESDPISEGLPKLYQEFKDAGVPVELHMLAGVGHGFGIRPNNPRHISLWLDEFDAWLDDRGLFKSH